jgi:WD repeat-containing protein 61
VHQKRRKFASLIAMPTLIRANLLKTLEGHRDAIYALAHNPASGELLSGGGEGIVAAWKPLESGDARLLARTTSTVYSLCVLNEWLGISCRDGSVSLIDLATGEERLATPATNLPAFVLKIHNNLLLVSQAYKILKYDLLKLSEPPSVLSVPIETIRAMDFTENGLLWIAGSDGQVLSVDLEGQVIKRLPAVSKVTVFTVCCLAKERILTGGKDAHLRLWSGEGELLQSIPAHNWPIYAIQLSPNQRLVATASRDKAVKIWDAETLELVKVLGKEKYPEAHSHSVNNVIWLNDNRLCSAGDDRKICVWEIESSK